MTIIEDRLPTLDQIELKQGCHRSFEAGACAMEAVAYLAGEPHSDHPKCASPVISAFMRDWNDSLDDEGRQKLKPYLPKLIGTVGTPEQEQIRGLMAADWFIHHHVPAWLQLAGLNDAADKIRALPVLDSWDAVESAVPALEEAKTAASAARSEARSAAESAAWSAAESAAWSAAWSAAAEAVKPVGVSLQQSAFELLDAMIAVGQEAA